MKEIHVLCGCSWAHISYTVDLKIGQNVCLGEILDEFEFKGGYLDFSHLSELKNIYITETYMKKLYKSSLSSIIKNHKKKFNGVPLKGYVASEVIFRFRTKNKKMHCWNI